MGYDNDDEGIIPFNQLNLTQRERDEIFSNMSSSAQLILQYMKTLVVGQDDTLKELALKLINYRMYPFANISPLFVTGPTGCGKTYSIKSLCSLMQIPFSEVNSASITAEGYIGTNPSHVISKAFDDFRSQPICPDLKNKSYGKINTYGIMYFDEFGKLLHKKNSVHDAGTEIQSSLLKMVEPGYFPNASILFIFADAMSMSPNQNITRNDLINLGFMPELAGRVHIVKPFQKLSKNNYLNILKLKSGHLNQKIALSSISGIDVQVTEEGLDEIASIAMKDSLGARSLSYVIDSIFDTAINDIIFSNGGRRVVLDRYSVKKCARNLTINCESNIKNNNQNPEIKQNTKESFNNHEINYIREELSDLNKIVEELLREKEEEKVRQEKEQQEREKQEEKIKREEKARQEEKVRKEEKARLEEKAKLEEKIRKEEKVKQKLKEKEKTKEQFNEEPKPVQKQKNISSEQEDSFERPRCSSKFNPYNEDMNGPGPVHVTKNNNTKQNFNSKNKEIQNRLNSIINELSNLEFEFKQSNRNKFVLQIVKKSLLSSRDLTLYPLVSRQNKEIIDLLKIYNSSIDVLSQDIALVKHYYDQEKKLGGNPSPDLYNNVLETLFNINYKTNLLSNSVNFKFLDVYFTWITEKCFFQRNTSKSSTIVNVSVSIYNDLWEKNFMDVYLSRFLYDFDKKEIRSQKFLVNFLMNNNAPLALNELKETKLLYEPISKDVLNYLSNLRKNKTFEEDFVVKKLKKSCGL